MFTNTQFDEHLTAMGHGGTLNKVRFPEAMKERAAATMLAKISPPETIRKVLLSTLSNTNTYDWTVPIDFKSLIDLMPADRSLTSDTPSYGAKRFDRSKSTLAREISFEGSGGLKTMRLLMPTSDTAATTYFKYYSKYFFVNADQTTITSRPTSDGYVLCDNDTLPIFAHECLIQMAHQLEGTDSAFDMSFARDELAILIPAYTSLYPDQTIKPQKKYSGLPRFRQ